MGQNQKRNNSNMEQTFNDLTPVITEVTAMLQATDDEQLIQEISQKQKQLKQIHLKKQQELKDIIAVYSGKINKLKSEIEKEEGRIERTTKEISQVESKQENVLDEISKLNEKAEIMDRQMKDLENEVILAEKRVQAAKQSEEISVPKIKHALSLYANISCIRWDFNSTDRVKGYISVAGNGAVRPFDLDKHQMSEYEISNYLWNLTGTPEIT